MVNKLKLASVVMNGHKTQAKIKDIGTILTGRTPSTSDPNNYSAREICFVKPSDLLEEKITTIEDTEFYISQKARTQSVCVPENSVLVTCIGIVGKIGITTKEMAFNQQINAIIPNSGLVSYKYLAYLLSAKRKYLSELANAPVVPILNKTNFGNITLSLHPLSEQKEIAERLDKVQELIALQKEQLKKLDDLIKSRFIDIFGNPITSKRFSRNTLRNCGTWQTGGTPSRQHHEYFGGKLPWITTIALENIYVGKNDAVDYISDIGLQNSTTKLIPEDSLLFAIRVGVGKVSINTCKICTNQDIVSLSLNPSRKYSLIYLYFMFRLCENYFIARTRGATIKGITVDTIKDFPIIDAPYALQTQFADFVTKIEAQKGLLATRLSHLETLYKSLMQEYFG